jgi:cation transport regulator ChaC
VLSRTGLSGAASRGETPGAVTDPSRLRDERRRDARRRSLWIFGYGSLVWRPDLPHAERRVACLDGWTRRFWQGSTDHRGVPGAPGRVVTLVESPGHRCSGVAYRVGPADRDAVLDRLDRREQGGYERREVTVSLRPRGARAESGRTVDALVYVAGPGNPNYLGPASLETIAAQVLAARGPSGDNVEYVLRLAVALRALGLLEEHDDQVFALERELARRLAAAATVR